MLAIFEDGHRIEGEVLDGLENAGWEIERVTDTKECLSRPEWGQCTQIEVIVDVTSTIKIVGHLDALGRWKNHPWKSVIEVKSMSDGEFKKLIRASDPWNVGLMPRYKWQVSAGMIGSGLNSALVIVRNRETNEDKTLVVDKPFYNLAQLRQRVLKVEMLVRSGGGLPNCDVATFPCPFVYLHDEEEREIVEDERLDKVAIAYKEAVKRAKVNGEIADRLKTELMEIGSEVEKGKRETERVKVTWYEQGNPPSVDREKLKELLPDGVDIPMKQTKGKRVRVEIKKGDAE